MNKMDIEEDFTEERIYVATDDEGTVVMCFDRRFDCEKFCEENDLDWTHELLRRQNSRSNFEAGKQSERKEIIEKLKDIIEGSKHYDTLEGGILEGFWDLYNELTENLSKE
jgi:hypothetical protein